MRSRAIATASALLAISVAIASGMLLVAATGVRDETPVLPLVSVRIDGIKATRVKIRMLCASTTRGRSAELPDAITTTAANAPGIEAQRAVTRSQP